MKNYQEIEWLGIAVVYMANEEDEKLLDLHFSQIEKHTSVPYTIFASTNRLLPEFLPKLEAHPKLKICQYAATEARGFLEHAYYLEKLVESALENGVSHVALLNVDSFPIRGGWAEELANHLTNSCVLAGVRRDENYDHKPHPCGVLFHRSFITNYQPSIILSDSELSSKECRRYLKDGPVIHDTGVGYGYKIHSEALSWYSLLRSNKGQDHYIIASIYDDLIFHLGGAARARKIHLPERRLIDERNDNKIVRFANSLVRSAVNRIPGTLTDKLAEWAPYLLYPAAKEALDIAENAYVHARSQLLDNPDSYIEYLRTGRNPALGHLDNDHSGAGIGS